MKHPVAAPPWSRRWRRGLFTVFSAVVFIVAGHVLWHAFHTLSWKAVEASVLQWRGRFLLAALLCGLSFGTVGVIEWRALRWAGAQVPFGKAFKVSFIANGLGHSLGAAAVVAGAVRARLYGRHGVGLTTSAAVTAFQTATSTSGFAALVGISGLVSHPDHGGPGPIVGLLTLGGIAVYLATCRLVRGSVRLWTHCFKLPTLKQALVQIGLGAADNGLAIGALYVLLPPGAVAYPQFAADYVIAYIGGALSGIPGGAGPFEGVLVKLLPSLDLAGLGAALLGFRLIFNLAPLIGAGCLLLISMARHRENIAMPATPTR